LAASGKINYLREVGNAAAFLLPFAFVGKRKKFEGRSFYDPN